MSQAPTHQSRHAAAIAAGQFSPHYQPQIEPMNTNHPQPIVTNARQGRPVSTANRPRAGRVNRPAVVLITALALFWVAVAAIISAIA